MSCMSELDIICSEVDLISDEYMKEHPGMSKSDAIDEALGNYKDDYLVRMACGYIRERILGISKECKSEEAAVATMELLCEAEVP